MSARQVVLQPVFWSGVIGSAALSSGQESSGRQPSVWAHQLTKCQIPVIGWTGLCIQCWLAFQKKNLRVIGWTGLCIHISAGARQITPISKNKTKIPDLCIRRFLLAARQTTPISVLACTYNSKKTLPRREGLYSISMRGSFAHKLTKCFSCFSVQRFAGSEKSVF